MLAANARFLQDNLKQLFSELDDKAVMKAFVVNIDNKLSQKPMVKED